MKYISSILILSLSLTAWSQNAKIVKLNELQNIIDQKSDKIKVINFWATWCAPCIKELPLFEQLHKDRPDVDVMLVSMDMDLDPNPDKVYKFVDRKKILSPVLILNEKDPNSWIDKIDKKWSGALPATLIVDSKTGHRNFVEKELHEGDLEALINSTH